MSEETKSFGRQCIYCRRIHGLGYCGYGISKGLINEHKITKNSKGNPQMKQKSLIKKFREDNYKKGYLKKFVKKNDLVKHRLGKTRRWYTEFSALRD